MKANTLKSNPILTEPINSELKEANNENNLLNPNDNQDDFVKIL